MSDLRQMLTQLAETREALLQASAAHPEQSIPVLEAAAEALSRVKTDVTHLSPAALAELKRNLRDVTALAAQAGSFYLGCAVILESLTRLYTPDGDAKTPTGRPSISVEV
jgi:hypothetical protein